MFYLAVLYCYKNHFPIQKTQIPSFPSSSPVPSPFLDLSHYLLPFSQSPVTSPLLFSRNSFSFPFSSGNSLQHQRISLCRRADSNIILS